ncbi:MAG: tetratricopeptide repeat protein [Chloroflexi bacterium]|nr:tetratricopeptide repeat protein [Chloroflexota bacterium]
MISLEQVEKYSLRLGLIAAAFLLWNSTGQLTEIEATSFKTWAVVLRLVEYLIAFGFLWAACLSQPRRWLSWLVLGTIGLLFLNTTLNQQIHQARFNPSSATDLYLYADYLGRVLLTGKNPFLFDPQAVESAYQLSIWGYTPLINGGVLVSSGRPALVIYLFALLHVIGLPANVFFFYSLLAVFSLIFLAAPRWLRPVVLLPFFLNPDLLNFAEAGIMDIFTYLLLIVMITCWKSPVRRAIFFGLACAFKQQAWFLAPLLVVRWWIEGKGERKRTLLIGIGVSALVFLILNAPFMLWDFHAWLTALTADVGGPNINLGLGLAHFVELDLIYIPQAVFSIFSLGTWTVLTGVYALTYRIARESLWIVPGIVLWLTYRSLPHYWMFIPLLLIYALLRQDVLNPQNKIEPKAQATRWQPRAAGLLAAGWAAIIVAGVVWYGLHPPALQLALTAPVSTSGDRINHLSLTVTNNTGQTLTPRFAVKGSNEAQPIYWQIQSGADQLAPGQSGDYQIAGAYPQWDVHYNGPVTVSVNQVDDHGLRTSLTLPTDYAIYYPGAVPNGDFFYWNDNDLAPNYWSVWSEPNQPNNAAQPIPFQSKTTFAARLHLNPGETGMRLNTQMMFPEEPISLWVNPPPEANLAPDFNLVYGVEMLAEDKRVWVLFGDQAAQGQFDDKTFYVVMPAPRGQWSAQIIEPRALFEQFGIALDYLRTENVWRYENSNYLRIKLDLNLMLAARAPLTAPITADFGPLHSTILGASQQQMTDWFVQHPEAMLIWRGNAETAARNYDLALSEYQQALTDAPDQALAYIGLGEVYVHLKQYDQASAAFQTATQIIQSHPLAYNNSDLANAMAGEGDIWLSQGNCFQASVVFEQIRNQGLPYPFPIDRIEACGGSLITNGKGN